MEGLFFENAAVVKGEATEQDLPACLQVDDVGQGDDEQAAFDQIFFQARQEVGGVHQKLQDVGGENDVVLFAETEVVNLVEVVLEHAAEEGAGFLDGVGVMVNAVEDGAVSVNGGGNAGATEAEVEDFGLVEGPLLQVAINDGVG